MNAEEKKRFAIEYSLKALEEAGIVLTQEDQAHVEVVDFGLGDLFVTGLQALTYVNNDRYCAKQLVFLPGQTCPEHLHPPVGCDPGKMETFRVCKGKVWVYTEGIPSKQIHTQLPSGWAQYFTAFHETELNPGEQCTITQGILHWFQAGEEGAVVLEVSSACRDEHDVFTNPYVKRVV